MLLGPIHQALNIFSSSFMVVLKILDLEKENILLCDQDGTTWEIKDYDQW